MNLPVVAVVGRPNVGKSALFNRLVGGSAAIVSDEAGTTRDRHFARAEWNGTAFWLVDTGGVTDDQSVPMDVEIQKQVLQAVGESDLLLLVTDARTGLHPQDSRVVDLLRDAGKPWLLVANKVDDPRSTDFYEFFNLGAGDPIPVSAQNGKGSGELLDLIVERLPPAPVEEETALRVAVVGRPNVGKSSFVNRLLGEERMVVAEQAGTTRDAIDTPMTYHGRSIIFIDTAGLRRQSKIEDGVEFYSALRSRRAIERADICILLIDASEGLENQDLKIATMAWEAGCGLIVVVNKWDLVEKDDKSAARFQRDAEEKAPYLRFVPFLFASALTGLRVNKVLDLVLRVEQERTKRISTAQVNERLEQLVARKQPPQASGREVKLLYATQVQVAPPTIAVFGTRPDAIQEHYVRYLHNGFRESWGFTGSPLRILLRSRSA
jgi:GTP-binding protein